MPELDAHAAQLPIAERAGPLWPVAERFASRLSLPANGSRSAAELLRALAAALERFVDGAAGALGEDELVEGAGALLGVLLVEHCRGLHASREGKHRVKLGAHGFFDPFAAIERSLDSDDPRAALAAAVREAEAELRGEGPLSRVVKGLCERLAEVRPDLCVAGQFDRELSLRTGAGEPFVVDLARAVDTTRDQPLAAVDRVVSRLVAMLPRGAGDEALALDFGRVREHVVPRLGLRSTLEELSARGHAALFTVPLCGELVVALQVEQDGRARYLREREIAAWGLVSGEAMALAVDNLARRSPRFRLVRSDTEHGPLYGARTGDGHDSARVLLPALHAELCDRLGAEPHLGIPHRDAFFACAAQPALLSELAQRTEHDCARAPHKLSARVYRLVGPGSLIGA